MTFDLPNGVNCTMLVPYTPDNRLDLPALGKMIDWYAQKGCKSLFAMCHSTEMHLLSFDERLAVIRCARENAERLARAGGARMPIVAAGALSYDLGEMTEQMLAIREAGADAVVLITNRLDPQNEGEKTFIRRAEEVLGRVPQTLPLGLYECPEPFKRVLTCREMRWSVDTGRIHFLKDTCCDPDLLAARLDIVRGSRLKLFNANAQTLLATLRAGAAGYSSCMANIHPELYVWLCENYARFPREAEHLQQLLCFMSFTETISYPLTAKYVMRRQGVPVEMNTRIRPATDFTPYHRHIMDQLISLSADAWASLPQAKEHTEGSARDLCNCKAQ